MNQPASPSELELTIVHLCGLPALLAPGLLRRALADVGAGSPPTRRDLLRALPKLESRMRAYLPHDEVVERTTRIRRLLAGSRVGRIASDPQG